MQIPKISLKGAIHKIAEATGDLMETWLFTWWFNGDLKKTAHKIESRLVIPTEELDVNHLNATGENI